MVQLGIIEAQLIKFVARLIMVVAQLIKSVARLVMDVPQPIMVVPQLIMVVPQPIMVVPQLIMALSQLSKVVAGVSIIDAQFTGFIPQRFNLSLLIIRKESYHMQTEMNYFDTQYSTKFICIGVYLNVVG